MVARSAVAVLLIAIGAVAQSPERALNPAIGQVVEAVSADRIGASMKMLESFGTRHIDSPGVDGAKGWIYEQFRSYGPRLEVSYQPFIVKKGGVSIRDVELANVIAVLPGVSDTEKDHYIVISAHYDSIHAVSKPARSVAERVTELVNRGVNEAEAKRYLELFPPNREPDLAATVAQEAAPGISDDASGIAAVLELARVMSQKRFNKTLVFAAFSSEESSHAGSKTYASYAKQRGMQIEAVLNNDIIGNDVAGNGFSSNGACLTRTTDTDGLCASVRVFAAGPEDSPHRALLRYVKETAERYVPSMQVEMIFHLDRFGRGGDQMSFVDEGFAAVRLTTPSENYANQHSATDTLANASVPYTTRVARINAAVAARLASAPTAPVVNWTFESGRQKGQTFPLLSRGSGYDAVLRWQPVTSANLAGYAVVIRPTTSPVWEKEIWVGNTTTYKLPDFSIDNVVLGVKAVDRDGNASLVSAYQEPPYVGGDAR